MLLHIECAFSHLSRGQTNEDETAFTDAIYRSNQAFEGSVKEAYRVLAEKIPDKISPFEIESYLAHHNVLRERVLNQFTNYRKEWRNPSTHDYKLDFDENEALLAAVSVTVFACVLADQIAEKVAFVDAKNETEQKKDQISQHLESGTVSLLEFMTEALKEFAKQNSGTTALQTEVQLVGALSGFFASLAPDIALSADHRLNSNSAERADIYVSHGDEELLVELKRSNNPRVVRDGSAQLERYLTLSGINDGILFVYPPQGGSLESNKLKSSRLETRIVLIGPRGMQVES